MKLDVHYVEKPWGRTILPPRFAAPAGRRIGEAWFAAPDGRALPLLAKYIFTSERLSIQVHPGDRDARARGHAHGKSECWYVLDADPGATVGLGLVRRLDRAALVAAARDGSIESLVDWRPVAAGDFISVPAGTIHAIGGGIALLELQQNADITYRLYDYGRPRPLHLDDAVAVARRGPCAAPTIRGGAADRVLIDGPHFSLLRVTDLSGAVARLAGRDRWVMPIRGSASAGDERAGAGEGLFVPAGRPFAKTRDAVLLVGAVGSLRPQAEPVLARPRRRAPPCHRAVAP